MLEIRVTEEQAEELVGILENAASPNLEGVEDELREALDA